MSAPPACDAGEGKVWKLLGHPTVTSMTSRLACFDTGYCWILTQEGFHQRPLVLGGTSFSISISSLRLQDLDRNGKFFLRVAFQPARNVLFPRADFCQIYSQTCHATATDCCDSDRLTWHMVLCPCRSLMIAMQAHGGCDLVLSETAVQVHGSTM